MLCQIEMSCCRFRLPGWNRSPPDDAKGREPSVVLKKAQKKVITRRRACRSPARISTSAPNQATTRMAALIRISLGCAESSRRVPLPARFSSARHLLSPDPRSGRPRDRFLSTMSARTQVSNLLAQPFHFLVRRKGAAHVSHRYLPCTSAATLCSVCPTARPKLTRARLYAYSALM